MKKQNALSTNKKAYVVLLHGLARTSRSMTKLENDLQDNSYRVINLNYPSRKDRIENLASIYLKKALKEQCPDHSRPIHFVTHSLGGIIVRYFLANNKLKNLGRVIMVAPPNKGAKVADLFSRFPIVNKVAGPALKQLKTGSRSIPNRIPPPKYEVGIIAGKYDMKVPENYTKLKNVKDFLLVPSAHTFIMRSKKVIKGILKFLERGKF